MKKNKRLRDALRDLISIVEIHINATGSNFAWAELDEARAALAEQEIDMEQQDKPMRWPADFPGKHDRQEKA